MRNYEGSLPTPEAALCMLSFLHHAWVGTKTKWGKKRLFCCHPLDKQLCVMVLHMFVHSICTAVMHPMSQILPHFLIGEGFFFSSSSWLSMVIRTFNECSHDSLRCVLYANQVYFCNGCIVNSPRL